MKSKAEGKCVGIDVKQMCPSGRLNYSGEANNSIREDDITVTFECH